jgi:hypothetical protein
MSSRNQRNQIEIRADKVGASVNPGRSPALVGVARPRAGCTGRPGAAGTRSRALRERMAIQRSAPELLMQADSFRWNHAARICESREFGCDPQLTRAN